MCRLTFQSSDDGIGAETTVEIDIEQEQFVATGLVIHQRNFLDVYPYIQWKGTELPEFRVGETFVPTTLQLTEVRSFVIFVSCAVV
jgi:DNA topoisomerase III